MFEDFFKTVIGKRVRTLALYVKESPFFTLIVVLILSIGVLYIREILDFIGRTIIFFGEKIFAYFSLFNSDKKIFSSFLLIFIFVQIMVLKKIFKDNFEENFNNYLRNWSIPKDAEWAITKDDDVYGNVLEVTEAATPGILKIGRDWYDYEVTFHTKIIEDNFTLLVRAKEKINAIMLQFKTNKLRPHLIINGIFIVDDKNEQPLQIKIPMNKWIKVVVKVKGEYIDIYLEGSRVSYRIPSGFITVPFERVHSTMLISELEELQKEYLQLKLKREQIEKDTGNKPNTWRIYNFPFDFDVGSIGFRESGKEKALFRKIKIYRN